MTAMASPPHRRSSLAIVRKEWRNNILSSQSPDKRLLLFNQIPNWHQDNKFIRNGYRPISGSTKDSFSSWLYLHNESMNIYSHLLPGMIFLLSGWYMKDYLLNKYPRITSADIYIFLFLYITVITSLGLSTIYHTLMNHSLKIEQQLLQVDLLGIVILILGDFISAIYMVFWCEYSQRKIYWLMIGALGLFTILINLYFNFNSKRFRLSRVLIFITTGLTGFIPLIHGIKAFGFPMMIKLGMLYYLIEGGFLLLGALIYVTRFPESQYPGKFDIYGSSHQLFHLLVVLATIAQLIGILYAFDYNYLHRACPSL